ncbi:MAG: acyltransferase [Acidimicrobiia bacterium]|nr:acyltransferase [Acidimicrobiia bacterium]
MDRRSALTLSQYVERRNGVPLGGRGALSNMVSRSLGADTFSGFWRYWNPIWGYYLGRYVNVPLRRVLPPPLALVGTFAVSGAIHDSAILVVTGRPTLLLTSWFTVLGLAVVLLSRFGVRYRFDTWAARAFVNVSILAVSYAIALVARSSLGLP